MADPDQVLEDIENGVYDGRLADVVNACRERAQSAGSSVRWRITVDGETWDEDTQTIGEMRYIEAATGQTWAQIEGPLDTAALAAAFIVGHFYKVDGMELAKAIERADAIPARELIAAVTQYEVAEPVGKGQAPSAT